MGIYQSTYVFPGIQYCDLAEEGSSYYASAVLDVTNQDQLRIMVSSDGGHDWSLKRRIYSNKNTFGPGIFFTKDGKYVHVTASVRDGTTGYALSCRYDMPDFQNFTYTLLNIPSGGDTILATRSTHNLQTGDFWLFAADASGNLYLAISSDTCATWGSFSTVESNVAGLSVEAGTGGRVYAAYRDMITDNVKVMTFTDPSTWTSAIVGPADCDASPVVAAEGAGSENVGVTYHDSASEVVLAISTDHGSSWTTNQYDYGTYPFLDVKDGASNAAICFGDGSNEEILVASAPTMNDLLLQTPVAVTDRVPFLDGPSVVRQLPSDVGMLYMVPTAEDEPRDLWIDCESFVGIGEGSSVPVATSFEVGPNPCIGNFSIHFELGGEQRAEVLVYSPDGRMVKEVFSGVTSGEDLRCNTDLPNGLYMVTLRTRTGISTRRIVSL
jgi:hypothetical protein